MPKRRKTELIKGPVNGAEKSFVASNIESEQVSPIRSSNLVDKGQNSLQVA